MTKYLIIRKTKIEDFETIAKQQKDSWFDTYIDEENGINKEEVIKAYNYAESPDLSTRKKNFIKAAQDKHGLNIVAEIDGKIVGQLYGDKNEKKNQIWAIHVVKEFQGKGIGKMLILEFLNWIDKDKPTYLGVISTNSKAISFYKKHGFVVTPNKLVDTLADVLPVSEMIRPADD